MAKQSLHEETAAFMNSIGLGKHQFIPPPSNGKRTPEQKRESKETSTKPKRNARKWGKEGKMKAPEHTKEQIVANLPKKSFGSEISWLNVNLDPNRPVLGFENDSKWYDVISSFDGLDMNEYRISKQSLSEINSAIGGLFVQEVAKYHKYKSRTESSQDMKWMNDVIKDGTLSDKIAALALRVQQSPPHELETLDTLIEMALKKEQRTSQLALEALKDLLLHNLLPDRRLIPYALRPLGHPSMSIASLLTFWYENELIKRIESITRALETGLKSTVDFYKSKCMEIASDWLCAKPEQENILLSLLVNKLGDPSSKVCSKCISLLGNVVYKHPAMKIVIIREVRQLISRSDLIPRAVYSGVLFLCQVKLSQQESNVAFQLVDCYVSLFEKAITQEQLGSKLLAALLSGINRAFPYLKDQEALNKHLDALFKIVHHSSFSSATQALTLISYLALGSGQNTELKKKNSKTQSDNNVDESNLISRYYTSLYSKLLSDEILTRSHNTLFLNLVFRSVKKDSNILRVQAFLKRLMICSTHATPPIAAGLLFLVSEICRLRSQLVDNLFINLEETVIDNSYESYSILGNFDSTKRNPEFACKFPPNLWELILFRSHFNPSVQTFASAFLDPSSKHTIKYNGDPTVDFSITSFLNRFAYKNPKQQHVDQRRKRSQTLAEEPINVQFGEPSLIESGTEIEPEKIFFYKYFGERNRLIAEGKSRFRTKKRQDDDENDENDENGSELGSDLDEAEIDRFADKLADDLMESHGKADIDDENDFEELEDFDPDHEDELEDHEDVELTSDLESDGDMTTQKKRKNSETEEIFASAEDFEVDMEANISEVVSENLKGKKKDTKRIRKD